MKKQLDPVKYELVYNKLANILEEGKENLRYLSGSTITREAGEVVMGYYLPSGEAALMATGILIHIMNVTGCIQYMIEKNYAEDIGIYEGDMFLNNDPYIGGQHTPDLALVAPVFYKGEHLGYVAAIAHTTEMGAIDPGSMSPRATESYHEGLHIPPIKLVEKGKLRRDIYELWLRAVRDPRTVELDTRAKIAGIMTIQRRLAELIDETGVDFFKEATRQWVEDAEALGRAKLGRLRPGIYRTRLYTDVVGGAVGDKLAIIEVELEFKEGGELVVRVPVVSPQERGFNNCHYASTLSLCFASLLMDVFYDLRWNTGTFHLVTLEITPHSRLSADQDYPVGYSCIGIGHMFQSVVSEALARAYYASGIREEVQAGSTQTNLNIWAGTDQLGRHYSNIVSHFGGGGGARVGKDGINGPFNNYNPWQYFADTEGYETIVPILRIAVNHYPDSGGFGRWRGGTHTYAMNMCHNSPTSINLNLGCNARINANQGLFGGYPGAVPFVARMLDTDFETKKGQGKIPYTIDQVDQVLEGQLVPGPPTLPAQPSKEGDILIHTSQGGAGLGDPIERDPEMIVADIREGLATVDISEDAYCVAIDSGTLEVDYEKTENLRDEKRKQRLRQGVPAKAFLRQMVDKRQRRDFPDMVLRYLEETADFCPSFKEQLEAEGRFLERDAEPIGKAQTPEMMFELTPYVNIGKDQDGRVIALCSRCDFAYCECSENFKLYCLVYERNPKEIHAGRFGPDENWTVYREFYCPGCGTQVEVEVTPPGTPILHNYDNLALKAL
jgi:N-methylhydantoinase B/oxoprolinase/acetone carboxylase alpha subunit